MRCNHCGERIPDGQVVYCHACYEDRPQTPEGQHHRVTETCEVTFELDPDSIVPKLKAEVTFLAQATGPIMEKYVAELSATFTINPSFDLDKETGIPLERVDGAKAALEGLITRLEQNSWERLGAGDTWFNQRFCRGWTMVKTE